jgi:hypothetical protein
VLKRSRMRRNSWRRVFKICVEAYEAIGGYIESLTVRLDSEMPLGQLHLQASGDGIWRQERAGTHV